MCRIRAVAAPPVPPARPAVRPCPPFASPTSRTRHFYPPCRALGKTRSLSARRLRSPRHRAFRSSTASSTSRLVERPFDARPVNRFISRGIFAPSRRCPLVRASKRAGDTIKHRNFHALTSRELSVAPPALPPPWTPGLLVRGRKRDWRTRL